MKIGYFYIKAGNGHYIPAKAMAEKSKEVFGDDSAELVDFYRDCLGAESLASWTQKMWSRIMLNPARERFESFLYDNNVLFSKSFWKYRVSRKYKKNFLTYMQNHKFDAIIITNCVAACILGRLVKVCRLDIPVYYYCSDLIFCYKFAARDKDIAGFIAPSKACKDDLIKKGAKNIIEIPVPIQNQIFESNRDIDKKSAKETLGLDGNKFSLLYQIGGEGKGRFKLLELCAENNLNINFIILGKLSLDTQEALDDFKSKYPNIGVTAPGFISNVQDYVKASDIVMSQSGLNAIAESLYLNTPVLLSLLFYVGLPMKTFIEKYKVGFTATTPTEQFYLLKTLISDPTILESYIKNIPALPLQYGAEEAVRKIRERIN